MADDCRCQNCDNAGRFTVVVTNARVRGQWCRNACSRMCAHILAARGSDELENVCGHTARSSYTIVPMLSGVDTSIHVK